MELFSKKGLLDLNHIHQEIDERFEQHRLAILNHRWKETLELYQTFEKALLGHMKEENEILLPIYQERAAAMKGGGSDIFEGEHNKVMEWLGRLRLRLGRIVPALPNFKSVLALLDDEAHFKIFMEHHSLREDRVFYPELERVTSEAEKLALCRLLTFSIDAFEDEAGRERGGDD